MGKASRDKGSRNERLLVHTMHNLGLKAYRVPLSGAMAHYKADVIVDTGVHQFKIEVKSRKCSFTKIYTLLGNEIAHRFECDGICVYITKDFFSAITVLSEGGVYKKETGKLYSRIAKMRELLGEAEILAIKDDRRPFMYIVFR